MNISKKFALAWIVTFFGSALVFTLVRAPTLFAQSSPTYRITHTYILGGDGGWDYVVPDPPNHRVFLARQNRVMVVDEDTGKLLGEAPESMARMEPQLPRPQATDSQR